MLRRSRFALLASLTLLLASLGQVAGQTRPRAKGVDVVGVFFIGAPLTGAVLHESYLYVTTYDRLSIYDTSDVTDPTLVGSAVSPRPIYGELLSTDGETLLLNNGLGGQTLDVWDVENKTNPVLMSSLIGMPDEHVSCVLDCSWAYGSEGSIVDIRRPSEPRKHQTNWKAELGLDNKIHRVDEYRPGFIFTAPRSRYPQAIDVRNPVRPRVVATARFPGLGFNPFLYSSWTGNGRGRFVISSSEAGSCDGEDQGALVTFDTRGWPRDHKFDVVDSFRYEGNGCTAYYYSLHPTFDDGGLLLLPGGLSGIQILDVASTGHISEVDSFVPVVSDVWLSFWADDEIFYALNHTGEVYILRYR